MSSNSNSEVDVIKSYTYVSLENLPSSFTLCTAFMVKTWNQTLEEPIFQLYDDEKKELWLRVRIFSGVTYTRYWFKIEDSKWFSAQRKVLFYPLQWTKVCLSRDSNTSSARLIVDGENLIEEYYMGKNKPGNLKLVLDYPGCTTNLNIFSTSLAVERMKLITTAGEGECGLAGDFLSWEKSLGEEQWTLSTKATWIDVPESPCLPKADMNIFLNIEQHNECMDHCKKLGGRSPPVRTEMEWRSLLREIRYVGVDPSKLPDTIWLSATEGDIDSKLGKLDHWPDRVEAVEGEWRDYYTGEQTWKKREVSQLVPPLSAKSFWAG